MAVERFIKVVTPTYFEICRVPELRGKQFFLPVQLVNGEVYGMVDPESLPCAYGFETFADAYKVIQDAEQRDEESEAEHYSSYSHSRDGEDFHSDG